MKQLPTKTIILESAAVLSNPDPRETISISQLNEITSVTELRSHEARRKLAGGNGNVVCKSTTVAHLGPRNSDAMIGTPDPRCRTDDVTVVRANVAHKNSESKKTDERGGERSARAHPRTSHDSMGLNVGSRRTYAAYAPPYRGRPT